MPISQMGVGLIESLYSSQDHPVCMEQWLEGEELRPPPPHLPFNSHSSCSGLGDTVLKLHLVLQGHCRVITLCESKHTLLTVPMDAPIFGNFQGSLK